MSAGGVTMKKFLKRFTKPQLLIMFFIPFGALGYFFGGCKYFFAVLVGWCLGIIFYHRKEIWRRLENFLRRLSNFQLKLLIQSIFCLPIMAACVYYNGWKGFVATVLGWCIGEMISRRLFKH